MRILVGVLGGVLVALMLLEIFLAFLLPRRVKRDPGSCARSSSTPGGPGGGWRGLLPAQAADTLLGVYGPFGLLLNLVLWVAVMMIGYACLQWAGGSHLGVGCRRRWTSATTSTSARPRWPPTGTAGLERPHDLRPRRAGDRRRAAAWRCSRS